MEGGRYALDDSRRGGEGLELGGVEAIEERGELRDPGGARGAQRPGRRVRGEPHLIAKMPDHVLWMTVFRDPDRNCTG
jgi:hypothetical protein